MRWAYSAAHETSVAIARSLLRIPPLPLPRILAIFVTKPEPEASHGGWLFEGAERVAELVAKLGGGLPGCRVRSRG